VVGIKKKREKGTQKKSEGGGDSENEKLGNRPQSLVLNKVNNLRGTNWERKGEKRQKQEKKMKIGGEKYIWVRRQNRKQQKRD